MFRVNNDPKVYASKNLITVADFSPTHAGGAISFDNQGNLFVALGDGGGPGNDPLMLAQNTKRLEGSVIRIKPILNFEIAEPYTIPATNPFVNDSNFRPEIWAYGFRNPFGAYFDEDLGAMLLADVGHTHYEELNIVKAGQNYGWPHKEGEFVNHFVGWWPSGRPQIDSYQSTRILSTAIEAELVNPLVSRPHTPQAATGDSVSCALVAVRYYNQKRIRSLSNSILNIDWCGKIYSTKSIRQSNGEFKVVEDTMILENLHSISDILVSEQGDIKLLGYDGMIYKLREEINYRTYHLVEDVKVTSNEEHIYRHQDFISAISSGDYQPTTVELIPRGKIRLQSNEEVGQDQKDCYLNIEYAVAGTNNFVEINGEKFYGYKDIPYEDSYFLNFHRGVKKLRVNRESLNRSLNFDLGFFLEEKYNSSDSRVESFNFVCGYAGTQ